jgi:Zn-dependent peptidase ImmA (M78 family)/transcriptional regulator with XRE-family HTH domain
MAKFNAEVLRWARETAGMDQAEAAKKLAIGPAKGLEPEERLQLLESGQGEPSLALIRKMAKQYRRPLISFYLSKPPERGERGQDFRTLPDAEERATGPLVDALIRDLKARQDMVRSLLQDDDSRDMPFIGSRKRTEGVNAIVKVITTTLGFRLEEFRAQKSEEEAFNYLRRQAEAQGIFVVLAGNLGSHHTAIDVNVFRGFALADGIAPFVVINDQDAKSAWSFTLAHELAHLWLGESGISGARMETAIEKFCSDVASKFLLPDIADFAPTQADALVNEIDQFARDRRISASMVTYRLFVAGKITEKQWRQISGIFRERWLAGNAARKAKAKLTEGGPNYYVIRRHRVGNALLSLISRSLLDGTITPTKAGKVLGIKPRSVGPLLAATSAPRAA